MKLDTVSSIKRLHSLDNSQLLQNRKGEGPQMMAPASNKMEKWSEKMRVLRETREFSRRSSQSLFIKNLLSNDLEGELPSLNQVNLPFCRGNSMRLTAAMNLLK